MAFSWSLAVFAEMTERLVDELIAQEPPPELTPERRQEILEVLSDDMVRDLPDEIRPQFEAVRDALREGRPVCLSGRAGPGEAGRCSRASTPPSTARKPGEHHRRGRRARS